VLGWTCFFLAWVDRFLVVRFFSTGALFLFDLVEVGGGGDLFDITVVPPSFDALHGAVLELEEG
jgi:hypothetical protein